MALPTPEDRARAKATAAEKELALTDFINLRSMDALTRSCVRAQRAAMEQLVGVAQQQAMAESHRSIAKVTLSVAEYRERQRLWDAALRVLESCVDDAATIAEAAAARSRCSALDQQAKELFEEPPPAPAQGPEAAAPAAVAAPGAPGAPAAPAGATGELLRLAMGQAGTDPELVALDVLARSAAGDVPFGGGDPSRPGRVGLPLGPLGLGRGRGGAGLAGFGSLERPHLPSDPLGALPVGSGPSSTSLLSTSLLGKRSHAGGSRWSAAGLPGRTNQLVTDLAADSELLDVAGQDSLLGYLVAASTRKSITRDPEAFRKHADGLKEAATQQSQLALVAAAAASDPGEQATALVTAFGHQQQVNQMQQAQLSIGHIAQSCNVPLADAIAAYTNPACSHLAVGLAALPASFRVGGLAGLAASRTMSAASAASTPPSAAPGVQQQQPASQLQWYPQQSQQASMAPLQLPWHAQPPFPGPPRGPGPRPAYPGGAGAGGGAAGGPLNCWHCRGNHRLEDCAQMPVDPGAFNLARTHLRDTPAARFKAPIQYGAARA